MMQRVPFIVRGEKMFDCYSGNDSDDQVLHEMEALQDEIGNIHNQLMML